MVLLLVSCSSSSISVREASSARGGTSAFNCPGGTFFIDFVHKILGHFPREAVESATLDAFSERSAPVPPACVPWASVLNVSHLSWPWCLLTLQLKLMHWIARVQVLLPSRSFGSAHAQCDKGLTQSLCQILRQLELLWGRPAGRRCVMEIQSYAKFAYKCLDHSSYYVTWSKLDYWDILYAFSPLKSGC